MTAPKSPLPLGPAPAPRACSGCRRAIGFDDACCPACFGRLPTEMRDALTRAGRRGAKASQLVQAKTRAVQWLAGHPAAARR